jgi:hypothetical protein
MDLVQTLHLRTAQEPQEHPLKAYAAMHAIVDYLESWHLVKIP